MSAEKRLIAELQSAHAWIVASGDREIQTAMRGDIVSDSNLNREPLREAAMYAKPHYKHCAKISPNLVGITCNPTPG